jgi:hypothetical protein
MEPCLVHAGSSSTFELHTSEKGGVLHHIQITQHGRSVRFSVHLRLVIAVSRPLLDGLQSGVSKLLHDICELTSTGLPTLQSRVSQRSLAIPDLTCTARTSLLFFTVAERAITATSVTRMHHTYICASRASLSANPAPLVAGCIFTQLFPLLPATSNRPFSMPSRLSYRSPQAATATPLVEYARTIRFARHYSLLSCSLVAH